MILAIKRTIHALYCVHNSCIVKDLFWKVPTLQVVRSDLLILVQAISCPISLLWSKYQGYVSNKENNKLSSCYYFLFRNIFF